MARRSCRSVSRPALRRPAAAGDARARVLLEPEVLLLDEPFNPLDAKLRGMMQVELRKLVKRVGIASIFVTHDQTEAFTLSDRIAVMREGVIEQLSEPLQIYDAPATTYVADFIGNTGGAWPGGRSDWSRRCLRWRLCRVPPAWPCAD